MYQGQAASRALELLGKHLGMFDKQRSEPTCGPSSTTSQAAFVDDRTDGERMRGQGPRLGSKPESRKIARYKRRAEADERMWMGLE